MTDLILRYALPTKEAAKVLGCDPSRVRKLVNQGLLEGFKDGASTRVYVDSLIAYQVSRAVGQCLPLPAKGDVTPHHTGHRQAMQRLQSRGLLTGFVS
ncbi:helix-turn-helix domain-containing protein [Ferrovibrio sp.]|uniref:helix-turn-helix domain-containing protein n=1 Tax=Ferrovibrio sp. TaxID=1917215 RepID=UPI0035164AF2